MNKKIKNKIISFYKKNGAVETSKEFNISRTTIYRYIKSLQEETNTNKRYKKHCAGPGSCKGCKHCPRWWRDIPSTEEDYKKKWKNQKSKIFGGASYDDNLEYVIKKDRTPHLIPTRLIGETD